MNITQNCHHCMGVGTKTCHHCNGSGTVSVRIEQRNWISVTAEINSNLILSSLYIQPDSIPSTYLTISNIP